jgi:hypothetical protein
MGQPTNQPTNRLTNQSVPIHNNTRVQLIADNALDNTSVNQRRTRLFKFYTGDGGSGPGRVELLIVTWERFELENNRVGLFAQLEYAPPSRHLTTQPPPTSTNPRRRGPNTYRHSTLAKQVAAAAVGGAGPEVAPEPAVAAAGPAGPAAAAVGTSQAPQGQGQHQEQGGSLRFPAIASVSGFDPAALSLESGATDLAAAARLFERSSSLSGEEEQQQQVAMSPIEQQQPQQQRASKRTRRRPAAPAAAGGGGGMEEVGSLLQSLELPPPAAARPPLRVEVRPTTAGWEQQQAWWPNGSSGGAAATIAMLASEGRASPMDARDLWGLRGGGMMLEPPPIITPDVLGVFEEDEPEGEGHVGELWG